MNVATSDMCVLLSPGHSDNIVEHQALSDKEVILVTLNLKGEFNVKDLGMLKKGRLSDKIVFFSIQLYFLH